MIKLWSSVLLIRYSHFSVRPFFLYFILFLFSSCTYYHLDRIYLELEKKDKTLNNIKNIYIESVQGRDSRRLFTVLKSVIEERGRHKIINKIIDSTAEKTAILRLEISDVIFYESEADGNYEEPTDQDSPTEYSQSFILNLSDIQRPVRVNSAVDIKFEMRRASDNLKFFSKDIGRSFQQVYNAGESIISRPDAEFEIDRLSRLIFSSFAQQIDTKSKSISVAFETGVPSNNDYRSYLGFNTNSTLVKGLRYAEVKNWELAMLTWMVVAFEPKMGDGTETFLKNRASAFYNMGQLFMINKQWSEAATMFAEANLTHPHLHYAQYWADMIIQQKKMRIELINRSRGKDLIDLTNPQISLPTAKTPSSIRFSSKIIKKLNYSLENELPSEYAETINRTLILNEKFLYTDIENL